MTTLQRDTLRYIQSYMNIHKCVIHLLCLLILNQSYQTSVKKNIHMSIIHRYKDSVHNMLLALEEKEIFIIIIYNSNLY